MTLTFEGTDFVDADVFTNSGIFAVLDALVDVIAHIEAISHESRFAVTRVRSLCVLTSSSRMTLVGLLRAFVDI